MNIKFSVFFLVEFLLFLSLFNSTEAFAKRKTPPRAYSFIAEAGKASQAECDGERKLPKLRKVKDFGKYGAYMGSELQDPEIGKIANVEMWKHFFRDKGACNAVLAKTPSAVQDETKKTKPELPPDDEEDDDAPESEKPGAADAD